MIKASNVVGFAAGVVMTGGTIGTMAAWNGLPASPGTVTPREVAAKAMLPLGLVTTGVLSAAVGNLLVPERGGSGWHGGFAAGAGAVLLGVAVTDIASNIVSSLRDD